MLRNSTVAVQTLAFALVVGSVGGAMSAESSRELELPTRSEIEFPLTALAPGAVRPEGWLRDWAQLATFAHADEMIAVNDEPNHDKLCRREQAGFLRAIREDVDLTTHWQVALDRLRIVLVADQSFREGCTMKLS